MLHSASNPLRKIRSFVLREGRITPRQKAALLHLWPQYGIDFSTGRLGFAEAFQNNHPVVLEIGYGMGQSLIQMAKNNPDINYLGVEVHKAGVGCLLADTEKEGLTNLRTLCHDAVEVLTHMIAPDSLAGIQVFFPDPWPKKKHHKRRIIQPDFVEKLVLALKPGGFIHCATDWQHYAEQMMTVLLANASLFNYAGHNQYLPRPKTRPMTKFELRGNRLNHSVWDLYFKKIDA